MTDSRQSIMSTVFAVKHQDETVTLYWALAGNITHVKILDISEKREYVEEIRDNKKWISVHNPFADAPALFRSWLQRTTELTILSSLCNPFIRDSPTRFTMKLERHNRDKDFILGGEQHSIGKGVMLLRDAYQRELTKVIEEMIEDKMVDSRNTFLR